MQGANGSNMAISDQELLQRLELLKVEHRDLDDAITALIEAGGRDQLSVARLKKRKLYLRDRIIQIENQLIPDIIA
tara:strand:+ start:2301 stop:2528 length:228 start_codon:yes stop_codon:yes gene_type:complete